MLGMCAIFAFGIVIGLFANHALLLSNIALRQQLAIFKSKQPRPHITSFTRLFWVVFSRLFSRWQNVLIVVRPETVLRWHRTLFKKFWTRKSTVGPGRPRTSKATIALIRKLAAVNFSWGAPRIHAELVKLGIIVARSTVSGYMPKRPRKPPSQTWRTFLDNHMQDIVAGDLFTIPTATFDVLYGFVLIHLGSRRMVRIAITRHPTSAWLAQQLREAFAFDAAPRFFLRDRDNAYLGAFSNTLDAMGIEQVKTAPRSPWQNAYVERLIGSIRRDLLDHVIVLHQRQALRLLRDYQSYYNLDRTHLSLAGDAPEGRACEVVGDIVSLSRLGGLHHRYCRRAV